MRTLRTNYTTWKRLLRGWVLFVLILGVFIPNGWARMASTSHFAHLSIPILGVTVNNAQGVKGVVSSVVVHFQQRVDQEGLKLWFQKVPGKFSPFAQHAVKIAIERAAAAAHLSPRSWSVVLTFPYPGMTMYGESLSAMVGLSVVAMAKGDGLINGRTITGTITEDGRIGVVGGIPQKIYAAHLEHLNRVFIPEEHFVGDGDWPNPFLMHVSPVDTVERAYLGLTGHHLSSRS